MRDRFYQALQSKIIPVVVINDAKHANPLADALVGGGLPCAEITFRTSAAPEAIRTIAARGDTIVGAGTVLKVEQVIRAVELGACFIVTPGFNPKVVSYCIANQIPVTPGISNPTDIEMALEYGIDLVKFFPAEAFGGLKTLIAMSAPYQMIKFIPTGGIGPQNVLEYLRHPKVAACGGSWMVASDLISSCRFDEIERLTKEAVKLAGQADNDAK